MKIEFKTKNLKTISKKIIKHPVTMSIIGSIGIYIFGKTLYKIYLSNPKLKNLINGLIIHEKEGQI